MNTLILDQSYRPHRIVTWQDAFRLMSRNKVEILEEYEEHTIRTVRETYKVPSVLRLNGSFKSKHRIRLTRSNLLIRDHFKCQYCGCALNEKNLTQDHVVPRFYGGTTCWENIVASCYPCNSKKKNRTPHEAGMDLLQDPFVPHYLPEVSMKAKMNGMPAQWGYWLGW
jgi:5-methylcytosine-specific restriction endonuclease McrA